MVDPAMPIDPEPDEVTEESKIAAAVTPERVEGSEDLPKEVRDGTIDDEEGTK